MKVRAERTAVAVVLMVLSLPFAPVAFGQATKTWISGVGDDANPCSRTAPCKTFAGAISKTAAGGEIDVLDPGGYGAVTITKAITLAGDGTLGSIRTAGSNGINISAGPTDVVTIRDIKITVINGVGFNGIQFNAGGDLHVENCQIYGFGQQGVLFQPSGNSSLFISNSSFRSNCGGAIYIKPVSGGTAFAQIDHVVMEGNFRGLRAEDGSNVVVRDSIASNNDFIGFVATASSQPVTMTIDSSVSTVNGLAGVTAGTNSVVYLSNSTVMRNNVGLQAQGGSLFSFGNNRVTGNTLDNGAPSASLGLM